MSKLFNNWKEIRVCARCSCVGCKCNFGTYAAGYVYKTFAEFLKYSYRKNKRSLK